MKIYICGIKVAEKILSAENQFTHVVSIQEVGSNSSIIEEAAKTKSILVERFHDIRSTGINTGFDENQVPNADNMSNIAAYIKKLPSGSVLLVHCHAGVSRSGAIGFAALSYFSKPKNYMSNLVRLSNSFNIDPSKRILMLLDGMLNFNSSLITTYNEWKLSRPDINNLSIF